MPERTKLGERGFRLAERNVKGEICAAFARVRELVLDALRIAAEPRHDLPRVVRRLRERRVVRDRDLEGGDRMDEPPGRDHD